MKVIQSKIDELEDQLKSLFSITKKRQVSDCKETDAIIKSKVREYPFMNEFDYLDILGSWSR